MKHITGDASTLGPCSANVPESHTGTVALPPAIIGHTLGAASEHPDYVAAKAGNTHAAIRLVSDLVTLDMVEKVCTALNRQSPTIVPVSAVEATGHNKIPMAVATRIGHGLGLPVDVGGIYQSVKAKRTVLSGLERIFQRPEFAGPVEPGRPYLLIDDTLTQGGTLAALAAHIEQGGGQVVGSFVLTGKQYSTTLRLSPETLHQVRERYGDTEKEFREATGFDFD